MNVRVSVCMATYNGAKYLPGQLDSILLQLAPNDELIISDDHSSDRTRELIGAYHDPRIILGLNPGERGHVQNFANAISQAKGQFIALSDQDDIWVRGRLDRMVEVIGALGCSLLIGDFQEFGEGRKFPPLGPKPKFVLPRLFLGKAKYFGCTFMMTKNFADSCLPIPSYIEAHDVWIAMNAAFLGSLEHLQEIVTLRRNHENNLTTAKRRGFGQIAKSRFFYALGLATAVPGGN